MSTFGSPTIAHDYIQMDYDGSGNLIYLGLSAPRVATSEAQWQIRKFAYDGSGNLLSVKYALGYKDFNQVWDDRAGLTYL